MCFMKCLLWLNKKNAVYRHDTTVCRNLAFLFVCFSFSVLYIYIFAQRVGVTASSFNTQLKWAVLILFDDILINRQKMWWKMNGICCAEWNHKRRELIRRASGESWWRLWNSHEYLYCSNAHNNGWSVCPFATPCTRIATRWSQFQVSPPKRKNSVQLKMSSEFF